MIGTLLTITTMALTATASQPYTDTEILWQAKNNCRNVNPKKVNEKLLAELLKIEKSWGVPDSLRGFLLASACQESGYNPNAEGDHRFSKNRRPKAIGLFQMWPWWESKRWGYGIDRRNPTQAANTYLHHISRLLNKVRRRCKISKRNVKKNWIVAWVTGIRGVKKNGNRCRERPKHLRTLKKWHRAIKRERRINGMAR